MKSPMASHTTGVTCSEDHHDRAESANHDHHSCDTTEPEDSSIHSLSDSVDTIQDRTHSDAALRSILRKLDEVEMENQSLLVNATDIIISPDEKLSFDSTESDDDDVGSSSGDSINAPRNARTGAARYQKIASDTGAEPSEAREQFSRRDLLWLLVCFTGIMASFVSYGIVLEYATSDGRRLHELSFIFVSSVLGSITAATGRRIRNEEPSDIHFSRFILLGGMSLGSTFCAIRALRYVIFPIQVLARSAKPVPVMLMGTVMGKRYPFLKYFYVLLIVLGVATFMGGGDISKNDSDDSDDSDDNAVSQQLTGILLLLAALFFDGSTGAYEDKLMSSNSVEPFDLMLRFQVSKLALSAFALLLFNQVGELFEMVKVTGTLIIALGLCSAIGQVFIFVTIAKFGALTSSLMSLTRKATTLAASIVIYGHPVNGAQIVGLFIGIVGMGLNTSNFGVNRITSTEIRASGRNLCLKRLMFVSASLMLVAGTFIFSWTNRKTHHGALNIQQPVDETAPPCTFDQLRESFGEVSVEPEQGGSCLSLSDCILKLSRDSIINFPSLAPLGHGNQSGVFKVYLQMANGGQCTAVYKTDLRNTNLCHDAWRHPSESWSHTKSCISAHMRPRKTTMPAERTGALLFQAQKASGLELPGLVPTWAVVYDQLHTEKVHRSLRWKHSSEKVIGVLEPFIPITSLFEARVKVATSVKDVVRIMLPAAEGVAFINELGFSHQDILFDGYKNVGLVHGNNSTHAVVYDHGYMAFDGKNVECDLGFVCDYCQEEFFPSPKMTAPVQYDLDNFRDITIDLLSLIPEESNSAKGLIAALRGCNSMRELAELLSKSF